jgi:hypothetical protein
MRAVKHRWTMLLAVLNLAFLAVDVVHGQIIIDDFESGVPPAEVPQTGMPWYVNSSGRPAVYRSQANPFSTGSVYAYLHDDINDGTNGTRLISSNTNDAGMKESAIAGQITTFSFDFWEPADNGAADSNNFGFGYTNADDLNANERNYKGFLGAGQVRPDSPVPGAGGNVAYALEAVHTVFMLANDSSVALADYRGGQTLDPLQADVWISLAGADPTYAFSVQKQFSGNPQGVGFRTFSADVEELLIDNVLLVAGASFDRGAFSTMPPVPGDTDGNREVNMEDFEPIRANFRKAVTLRNQGDLVRNGVVDFDDFRQWKTAVLGGGGSLAGVDFGSLSNVPEPGTVGLLLAAFAIAATGTTRNLRARCRIRGTRLS